MRKIYSLKDFRIKTKGLSKSRKSIGLCHGVFDLLHLGHIRHFQEAKNKVDTLIVSVTEDKYVNKGPGRPVFNHLERAECLASLEFIDYVVISDEVSAAKVINLIRPNFYFKGPDYKNNKQDITGKIFLEKKLLKKNKGKIIYTSDKKFSSTILLKNYINFLSSKQKESINKIKKNNNFKKIVSLIDDFKNIRPTVIGETIIDVYQFTETMGKSGKEPVLVLKKKFFERYLGGAGAICRHLSSFVNKLNLISYLGEKQEDFKFIKKNLGKKVIFNFIKKKNSPTIIKERFVEEINNRKIFGAYSLNDSNLNIKEEKILTKKLINISNKSDLIIVSDYGHGLISKKFAKKIIEKNKFVAVNVQINSSNIGYHSLQNYKNSNCIIINENELRYEMRSKIEKIENLIKILSNKLKVEFLVVTRGSSGAILYNAKFKKFYYSDAFTDRVVDKVGAGDAMLSTIALCLYKKIDCNLSLLISSLCASQSVSSIGNKKAIDKNILIKELEHYLI